MGIKVGIFDTDIQYMERFQAYCELYYSDGIEVIPFDSIELVNTYLEKSKLLLLLVGGASWKEDLQLNRQIPMIKFVDYREECVDTDKYIIFKYQKLEEIYKKLLDIAADEGANYVIRKESGESQVILFTSPQGGIGKTSVAIAYAAAMASYGKHICYLPLEPCGSTNVYFNEGGNTTLSDVIFVLKSKKQNISLKLESALVRSEKGIEYYKSCVNPNDLLEMTPDDIESLVTSLLQLGKFDTVVIDYNMNFTNQFQVLNTLADQVILLNDGTQTGNYKMLNAIDILKIMENKNNTSYLHKYKIAFNKFSTNTSGSKMLDDTILPSIGIIPYISGGNENQKINQIQKEAVMDRI